MANITINIKNCGCGGGTTARTPTAPTEEIPEDGWSDPTSPAGPPEGWAEPASGITDRQCKVSVWLYDWWETNMDFFGNDTTGGVVVSTIKVTSLISIPFVQRAILAALPTLVGLLSGPDPSDVVLGRISWGIAGAIVSALGTVDSEYITQPLIRDTLEKVQPHQDEIICQVSKATDAFQAYNAFVRTIESIDGLIYEQKQMAKAFMPRILFNHLFHTADYWPSFDDDYLAGITTTCCGDYTDGEPVVAGSDQACSAATYIVEQLVALFKTTGEVGYSIWRSDLDRYSTFEDAYREYIQQNLTGYQKIKELTNWNSYLSYLAKHVYLNRGYIFQLVDVQTLWEYHDASALFATSDNLSARLRARRSEAIDALFTAADKSAAYTALDAILDAEIDLIDTDEQIRPPMKSAIEALINPNQSKLLDLLFTQDSDLLAYPGDCAPPLPAPEPGQTTWYPIGTNTCSPVSTGNCDDGDGQPDGFFTDPITTGYHQVEFTPLEVGENTRVDAYWKSTAGAYGNLYLKALLDGEWVTVRSSLYQYTWSPRWEGSSIGGHAGKYLSGLRFGFSGSKSGHRFAVGGYRVMDFVNPEV